jgi:ADP-ribose pyrophosphatase
MSRDDAASDPAGARRPVEPAAPWRTLATRLLFTSPWFALRQDRVLTHAGREITYTYVDQPDVVAVVPLTAEGDVALLRQYRYPVREWVWEVPSGRVESAEDLAAAAARELEEECGGVARALRHVGTYFASDGNSNARCHAFLATGVVLGENRPEPTELLRVVRLPLDEALRLAHAGAIADALSALALLLAEPRLRAEG